VTTEETLLEEIITVETEFIRRGTQADQEGDLSLERKKVEIIATTKIFLGQLHHQLSKSSSMIHPTTSEDLLSPFLHSQSNPIILF